VFHPEGPTFFELVAQALASTERGYDMLAPKFDHTPFRTPDAVLEPIAQAIGPVGSALDVCCGTGAAMRWLKPLCKERVVGIDFSAGMLAKARANLEGVPGSARVELHRGDVLEMSYDAEFDVATCVGAFGHIEAKDEDRFVANVARALKPRGRFVFATAELPKRTSPNLWVARGFNAAMHVRNALVRPRFVMYYLTFLWPDVLPLLERHGFRVAVTRGLFPEPFDRGVLVEATRATRAG
jgi:ubiquinone/menaquinone biosynthesis C-methylase UbiE